MEERLQKYIASCGVCSRRKAEELILAGQVSVNGVVIDTLGSKVSSKDQVLVNGKLIEKETKYYYVINKPRGVVSTVNDPFKRTTIIDILPSFVKEERIYPVGRLDYDTKGVLLLTNDGSFMNELVGPKSNIEKEYLARVKGIVSFKAVKALCTGVMIDNKMTRPCEVFIVSKDEKNNSTLLRIIIKEGAYHQVKKMCSAVGHDVKKLTRVRFGHITIDDLETGKLKRLSVHDVKILHELATRGK